MNIIHNASQKGEEINVPALAATLRSRVCDMLIENTFKAAQDLGYKKIVMAGGVSANSELRSRMEAECKAKGFEFYCPDKKYCGDNAAMVGVQAFYEYEANNIANADLNATATLPIDYNN